ncbi:hypothetical protein IKB17_03965 [bacterium]|nr:hypothetical protein [bacterium]
MVSAINAITLGYYTSLANQSAFNMMSATNARMGMLSSPMMNNISFGSLEHISAIDTQYQLSLLTNSLQYKMAKAMKNQLEKQQKEDAKRFNVFA